MGDDHHHSSLLWYFCVIWLIHWYSLVDSSVVSRDTSLSVNSTINVRSPNYPLRMPNSLCSRETYRVPYGYQIHLDFKELYFDSSVTRDGAMISMTESASNLTGEAKNFTYISPWNRVTPNMCTLSSHKNIPWRRYDAELNVFPGEGLFFLCLL